MDNRKKGEELNQLSRLLFDKAANLWYVAIFIETLAGIYSVVMGLITVPANWKLILAILGFSLLVIAYVIRLKFDEIYDNAETMRRQSVLSEALDWPINAVQFSEWRRKAGKDILQRFSLQPRDNNYYATQQQLGPKRLLEMTAESAFWTRHLYHKLRTWIWVIFLAAVTMVFLIVSITAANFVPDTAQQQIVYAIYLFLPILLTVNLLGWALRLSRLISEIKDIENDLDRLASQRSLKESEVMRLVSEYNCQVALGFPIHQWLFKRWHNEIQDAWDNRP